MNSREKFENVEKQYLSCNAKLSCNSLRKYKELPHKYKTTYQEDVERILYSDAFRRLRSKSQVFYASGTNQHDRTRLTHSLEVANTAKIIANALSLNSDLAYAIALGHDIGHTPFGHAGERALNICLKKYNKVFNHNAQSVWLASIMKSGIANTNDFSFNLTYDTLEGMWKHTKIKDTINKDTIEYDFFKDLNPDNSLGSLESQIVNLSDTISYNYHDMHDAIRKKIITKEAFIKEFWNDNFNGIKYNNNSLIEIFVDDLIKNNMDKLNTDNSIIEFSTHVKPTLDNLKDYTFKRIINTKKIRDEDSKSEEIITTLFEYYIDESNFQTLLKNEFNQYKLNNYGPERVVTDYIQWFGDESAKQEYNKICK